MCVSVYAGVCFPVYKDVSTCVCVHGAKGCNHESEPLDDDNVSVLDGGSFSNKRPRVCFMKL